MELFLNAVWALLAVTALTRLGRRSTAATLATICALALLFPIISITDDLHATAAAVEEMAKPLAVTTAFFAITVTLTLLGFTYEKPLTRFSAPVWCGLSARAP